MKKVIALTLAAFALVATIAPKDAEAEYRTFNYVLFSNNCCENVYNTIACNTVNYAPVGNACTCPGWAGYGHAF